MTEARRKEINGVAGLVVIILVGAIVILAFYKYTRPEFGEDTMSFAMDLSSAEAAYAYVGNMNTQVYYPSKDPRVRDIPKEDRVYFKDEKTAKEYNYTRSP